MMKSLQEKIIAELKVKPVINPQEEIRKSVDFMKEYAKKHSFLIGFRSWDFRRTRFYACWQACSNCCR